MAKTLIELEGTAGGAIKATRDLENEYARLEKRLGGLTKENKKLMEDQSKGHSSTLRDVQKIALAYGSVTGIIQLARRAFGGFKEDAEQFAQTAEQAHESMLDLFMLQGAKDSQFFKKLTEEALSRGVRPGQYAMARESFVSATAGMPEGRQRELWDMATQHRSATRVDLGTLAELYAKAGTMFEGASPQQLQNFIFTTIKQAATTAQAAAPNLPRVMGAGRIGKMSPEETGAMFAAVTQVTGTPEVASTTMENMVRGVMLQPEKDDLRVLKRAGVTSDMNFWQRWQKLQGARAAGKLSDLELLDLMTIRGMRGGAALIESDLIGSHLKVFEATRGRRVLREQLETAMQSPEFREIGARRGVGAATEAAEISDVGARESVIARDAADAVMKRFGAWRYQRTLSEGIYWTEVMLGRDPREAAINTVRGRLQLGREDALALLNEASRNFFDASSTLLQRQRGQVVQPAGGGD